MAMPSTQPNIVTKTHPATREILPDDPLEMQAIEVPGDAGLMLQLLVEEFARIGHDLEQILQLARDPNYLAFHAALRLFGPDEFRRRVSLALARCGVVRARTVEAAPETPVVEIELPD